MSNVQIRPGGSPIPAGDLVATDGITTDGDGSVQNPIRAIGGGSSYPAFASNPITKLMALTPTVGGATGRFVTPVAGSGTTGPVTGLALTNAPNLAGHDSVTVQPTGPVTATTAEWDAVTGDSGGLVRGSFYYLSHATLGHITRTQPTTGQIMILVGVALDATTLQLQSALPLIAP